MQKKQTLEITWLWLPITMLMTGVVELALGELKGAPFTSTEHLLIVAIIFGTSWVGAYVQYRGDRKRAAEMVGDEKDTSSGYKDLYDESSGLRLQEKARSGATILLTSDDLRWVKAGLRHFADEVLQAILESDGDENAVPVMLARNDFKEVRDAVGAAPDFGWVNRLTHAVDAEYDLDLENKVQRKGEDGNVSHLTSKNINSAGVPNRRTPAKQF